MLEFKNSWPVYAKRNEMEQAVQTNCAGAIFLKNPPDTWTKNIKPSKCELENGE